jgi:hypothetical protein
VSQLQSMKKIVEELPDKEEYQNIKAEASIQFDKIQQGLELIKRSLDDTNLRNERGESIYA